MTEKELREALVAAQQSACHVVVSAAHVAAGCACGWNSDAVADHAAKLAESETHMHQRYSVFVQSTEDDGTTVLCWGTP